MLISLVTNGLLGMTLVSDGLVPSVSTSIITFADPRQGYLLSPDNDPTMVDPRQGYVLSPDNDPTMVDPRQGYVLSPDNDPTEVDPRQGQVLH